MRFIEIKDTEGNIHLVNPNHIAVISDIREYRIILLHTKDDQPIITNTLLSDIKDSIHKWEHSWQNIHLNGGTFLHP